MFNILQKLLAPPFCFYCRHFLAEYRVMCEDCFLLIKPVLSVRLQLGGEKYMNVFAVAAYEEPLLSLVLSKGWSDYTAAHKLGAVVAQKMGEQMKIKGNFDYIVPVPLHFVRKAVRGFNQAEVIAREVEKNCDVEVVDCLKRNKWTKFQSAFRVVGRYKNVEDAFVLNDFEQIKDKRILLIDDVMTTGSTLAECAKALIKAKPKSITALVACRVL